MILGSRTTTFSQLRYIPALVAWMCCLVTICAGCNSLGRRKSQGNAIRAREMTRLGQDAMVENRWQEAETRLGHAVQLCPEDVTARRHYAQSLWRLGQKEEAIKQLRYAVEMSGGDPDWTVELGEMLLAQDQLDQAEVVANQALEVDDGLAAAWELRANVLLQQGQENEALNDFHRARSLGGDTPQMLANMAAIYERKQRPHRVLASLLRLEERVGAYEMSVEDLQRKGLALRQVGRTVEAVDTLTLAHQRSPQNQEVLVQLADCQVAAGQIAEASKNLELARALGELDPSGQSLLATIQTEIAYH